jgi:RHS repeat-associated protein
MISVANGGKVYRIISDWVGSVRLVLDTSVTPAAVVQQLDYDEFGNVLPSSFDTTCASGAQCLPFQPFGFAGGLQDRDTGLVRFGARDYDPQVGRWASKDPIRFGGGLNLYGYANNDPINFVDVTGHWVFGLGLNVGYGVGAGTGSGGYGEIGVWFDTSNGTWGFYTSTAHANDSTGAGLGAGGGVSLTCTHSLGDFLGAGYEDSLEVPKVPFGPNFQIEYDNNGNVVGEAGGISGGFGGGFFNYTTNTVPLGSPHGP